MEITIYWLLPKSFVVGYVVELGDEETQAFLELHLGIIGIGFYRR